MSRSRSDVAHTRRTFRLRLDNPSSRPVAFIPPAYLRLLTDHLHDFTHDPDRKDRHA